MANVRGCDISRWQGTVNFDTLATQAKFVFIKLSEGSYPDPQATTNWAHSRGKLPRGGYNYFHPELAVADQLRVFLAQFGGDPGELPAVIDIETPQRAWNDWERQNLRLILEGVASAQGRNPLIYSGRWFLPFVGNAPWMGAYDVWLAQYTDAAPIAPLPWKSWRFWQWTSGGHGADYGVASGDIDLNYFNGDEQAFSAYLAPKDDPVALTFPRNMVVSNFGSSIDGIGARVLDDAGNFIGSLQQGNVVEIHAIDAEGFAHMHLKTDSGLRLVGATTLAEPEVRVRASLLMELSGAPHPSPNFKASALKVYPTQAVTLSWLIRDVKGVKLNTVPEAGDLNGQPVTRIREPQVSTTYVLRVQYNDNYVIEYPVHVEVTGPAPLAA